MCGIVGIVNKSDCIQDIILGLQSLEYRGYDSSGIATIIDDNFLFEKVTGKISSLKEKILKKKNTRKISYWSYKMGYSWETFVRKLSSVCKK